VVYLTEWNQLQKKRVKEGFFKKKEPKKETKKIKQKEKGDE